MPNNWSSSSASASPLDVSVSTPENGKSQANQLYYFTVRISLDWFCRKDHEQYHPDFENVESIKNNVVPKLLDFLYPMEEHLAESRIVKSGVFQLECTKPEEPWGFRNLHFQMVWNLTKRCRITTLRNKFRKGFGGREPYRKLFAVAQCDPCVSGKYTMNKLYCTNDDTRVAGPWNFNRTVVYRGLADPLAD